MISIKNSNGKRAISYEYREIEKIYGQQQNRGQNKIKLTPKIKRQPSHKNNKKKQVIENRFDIHKSKFDKMKYFDFLPKIQEKYTYPKPMPITNQKIIKKKPLIEDNTQKKSIFKINDNDKFIKSLSVKQQQKKPKNQKKLINPQAFIILKNTKLQSNMTQTLVEQPQKTFILGLQACDDDFWQYILTQKTDFTPQNLKHIEAKVKQELQKYQDQWIYFQEKLTLLNNLALFYEQSTSIQGIQLKILQIYEQILRLSQKYYSKDDERSLMAKNNLACYLYKVGNRQRGQRLFKECLISQSQSINDLIRDNMNYYLKDYKS